MDLQLTKSTSSCILFHKGEIVEASIITASMAQAYAHEVIQYLSGVDGLAWTAVRYGYDARGV